MTSPNLHEYNDLMGCVELPDHVREAVLREARTTKAAGVSAPRRRWGRAIAAGGCAVALAVALAVGLNAAGLLASTPEPAPEGSAASVSTNRNFFALAAYAAENPEQEPGKTVELSLGAFRPGSASGDGLGQIIAGFDFDITCTGDHIASITYELEGDGLFFEWYDEEQFLRAHGVYGEDDPAVEEGYTIEDGTAFSVDYDEQNLDERRINCSVFVPVQLEGELLELDGQMYSLGENYEEIERLSNRFWAMAFSQAADNLARSTFKMTATFEDGTTQTKSYVIAPVADFEELYRDHRESRGESDLPALFTITESVAA